MARISTYAIDGTPVSSDKVIGTDSSGTTTKNYPLGSVADWLKESGASAVLGQNNYSFQIALDPDAGRLPGSFSFENYGGDGTEFINVSRLTISKSSSTGKYVGDYLLSTVGDRVMLGQLDDLNSFGVYTLVSLVQNSIEPTFYDAELLFVEGNGALQGNKSYGLATYSASASAGSAVWGSIEGTVTNQTDLVGYIDAEIAAIPTPATPTLQTVTDAGAITTNDITTGSVTSNGNFLITGNDSTVQLRGSSVDFNIQTTAADNVARIATTTGGSARLDLYNHISGFDGALEFRATSWENDALVISGGTPNTTKFLVSRDPNAATLQVTGDTYISTGLSVGTSLVYANSVNINNSGQYRIGNAEFISKSANDMNIYQGRMWVTNAGKVGIGTTAPNKTLDIRTNSVGDGMRLATSSNAPYAEIINGNSESFPYGKIALRYGPTNGAGIVALSNSMELSGGYTTAGNIRFRSNTTEVMRMTNVGLGIGTTAPAVKLHVATSTSGGEASAIIQDDVRTGTGTLNYIGLTDSAGTSQAKIGYLSTLNGDLSFSNLIGNTTVSSTGQVVLNASSNILLNTNGSTSVKIDNTGKVGIGTTAPSYKLHVDGGTIGSNLNSTGSNTDRQINLTSANTTGMGVFSSYSSNTDVVADFFGKHGYTFNGGINTPSKQFQVYVADADNPRMVVNGSGNVGIGTTAPLAKLHVKDANVLTTALANTSAVVEGFSQSILQIASHNTGYAQIAFGDQDDGFDGGFIYSNASRYLAIEAANAERMRFTSNGTVGIGTTAPVSNYKLHVVGSSRTALLDNSTLVSVVKITNSGTGNGVYNGLDITTNSTNSSDINSHGMPLTISTSNTNGVQATERMRITGDGNVGIGTTAPSEELEVNGNVKAARIISNIIRDGNNNGHLTTTVINASNTNTTVGNLDTANTLTLGVKSSGAVTTQGNLGIGTTAPDSKLQINGTAMRQFRLEDKAVEVADKFIETPEEKKAFMEKAYEQEVEDRRAARDLGKNKATPDILTYVTLVIALGLATAIFTDFLDWKNLTEVQKGLITTFSGFFLRTLGDVYGYWFGSSMGSSDKTKDLTKLMRK
jgi:hypothetical protein